ncbi:hypothetical protein [Nocardia abscessus]|uniref:hypothetical protein n=1 Tax=Nocardia abscessus TaxID=120957 RepID=UPI0024584DCB|nr:hypothetical protein [Nocardia abscessus]
MTRAELITQPPGTLYAEARGPGQYGELLILGSAHGGPDFMCRTLDVDAHDSGESFARDESMWKDGASFPINEAYQRDGMFNDTARYLVYEPADIASVIAGLNSALKGTPPPGSPGFVALVTGEFLWSLQQAQAAIFNGFGVTPPAPVVWVVERPIDDEAPVQIAWCTTDQDARKAAAEYWRFVDWEDRMRLQIFPRPMNTTWGIGGSVQPDGFAFDGTEDDARAAGWLDAAGNAVDIRRKP